MAITNVNNDHFSETQIVDAKYVAAHLFEILNSKTRNLTPEERKEWGSINEQNKLVPLKVLEYAENEPQLKSPEVDYTELAADWNDRMFLSGLITLLENVIQIADNIRITHDWDAYQASKQDYRHAEYKTLTDNGAAFEGKFTNLKAFFTTNPNGNPSKPETPAPAKPADTTPPAPTVK